MNDKITELPNIERDAAQAQIEQVKRNMPVLEEQQKMLAQVLFVRFKALKDAGFSEAQALQLVKS